MSFLNQGLVGERGEGVPGPVLFGCGSPRVSQSKVSRLASGHVPQVSLSNQGDGSGATT